MSIDHDEKLEPGWVIETWAYAGQRLNHQDKPVDAWFDGTEQRWFKVASPARFVIGRRYSLQVQRGDEVSARLGSARITDETDGHRDEWRIVDQAAKATLEQHRAEQRARKEANDIGDLTLAEIKDTIRRQVPHQRTGMIAAVTTYLLRGES